MAPKIYGYCVQLRKKVIMENLKLWKLPNGRLMLEGSSKGCPSNVFKFVGEADAKKLGLVAKRRAVKKKAKKKKKRSASKAKKRAAPKSKKRAASKKRKPAKKAKKKTKKTKKRRED